MMTDTADIEFALSDDGKCRAECCEGENVKHSVSVHSLSSADFTRSQSTVFPWKADSFSIGGFKPLYISACPCLWHSRQKFGFTVMALHKHFADCRTNTKITVNLKGRMSVQHIGIDRFFEHINNMSVCRFSVLESCIHICYPCVWPARMSAAVGKSVFKRFFCGFKFRKFRRNRQKSYKCVRLVSELCLFTYHFRDTLEM